MKMNVACLYFQERIKLRFNFKFMGTKVLKNM